MEAAKDRMQLVEKIFDQALKERLSKLEEDMIPTSFLNFGPKSPKMGKGRNILADGKGSRR
jgi:hypothetical protein